MEAFVNGFVKRAQEYGLNQNQVQELFKSAKEEYSRKEDSKNYMNQGIAGALGDYLTPATFGGHRAGKMTALSKALGHEPGFSMTNPLSSSLLGAGGGALAGGGIGTAIHKLMNSQGWSNNPDSSGGGAIGAGAGGILGFLLPALLRRMDNKDNLKEYSEGAKVHPEKPAKLKGIGNFLLPNSSSHRSGEAIGYNKLRGLDQPEMGAHSLNILKGLTNNTLPMVGWATGAGQNYHADEMANRKR